MRRILLGWTTRDENPNRVLCDELTPRADVLVAAEDVLGVEPLLHRRQPLVRVSERRTDPLLALVSDEVEVDAAALPGRKRPAAGPAPGDVLLVALGSLPHAERMHDIRRVALRERRVGMTRDRSAPRDHQHLGEADRHLLRVRD